MAYTETRTTTTSFVLETCTKCGVHYMVPDDFLAEKEQSGDTWYCPNGHPWVYSKSTAQKLREELEAQKRKTALQRELKESAQEQRDAAVRSVRAQKAAKTRIKNRIAKGVCPCCNRTFKNLARHMNTQHPNYTSEE